MYLQGYLQKGLTLVGHSPCMWPVTFPGAQGLDTIARGKGGSQPSVGHSLLYFFALVMLMVHSRAFPLMDGTCETVGQNRFLFALHRFCEIFGHDTESLTNREYLSQSNL